MVATGTGSVLAVTPATATQPLKPQHLQDVAKAQRPIQTQQVTEVVERKQAAEADTALKNCAP